MKKIASRANERFQAMRRLVGDAREQRRLGLCALDGSHLVSAYLDKVGPPQTLIVSASGHARAEIAALVERLGAAAGSECVLLDDSLFASLSQLAAPAGIMAIARVPAPALPRVDGASCVLLDAVQDAGNVGTILRSAAAAGIRDVYLGQGCAAAWMPRVLRAAQGAHFDLAIVEQADLVRVAQGFSGTVIAATAQAGEDLFALDLRGAIAWLFGNEGAGVSPELLAVAGRRVSVPMAAGSESLNVAAAAAVCLFEALRQKRLAGPGTR